MPATPGTPAGASARVVTSPAGARSRDLLLVVYRRAVVVHAGRSVLDLRGRSQLHEPEPLEAPWVAVAIVLFAMTAEGISLRVALAQIDKVRRGLSLWRWFRETRRSELIIVLAEDLAALAGLMLALAALLGTIATDNAFYDALGSIGVGVLLIVVASVLAIEIKSLLIGESAPPRTRR